MTFRGVPIDLVPLPDSGVRSASLYEFREAAHWARLTWAEFCALEVDEQAATVAHYRTHHRVAAALAKHEAEQVKRKTRPKSKGPPSA